MTLPFKNEFSRMHYALRIQKKKKLHNALFVLRNSCKGFTLIELLIVMAIIGVLASLLLSSFIGVRQRARDGRRKSDVSQIQSALEQYRSDSSIYPATATFPACGNQFVNGNATYMQKIPCDPLGSGSSIYNSGSYYYVLSGSNYFIVACLENTSDTSGVNSSDSKFTQVPSAPNTNCTSNWYYIVQNP